jgi:hypothetical protein
MKNAVVSGQAGVVFLFKGKDAFYIRHRRGEVIPCRLEDFPFLFGDARDLLYLEDTEISDAVELLRREVAKEEALQIALILLDGTDGGYPPRVRSSAARELEELLADVDLEEYLSRVLFAHPLTRNGDLDGAFTYVPMTLLRLRNLIEDLCLHQTYVAIVCRAWEAIPTTAFGGLRERALAKARIIRIGGFRDLARARAAGSEIGPSLAQHWPPDLQTLLDEWASMLRLNLGGDAPWPVILDVTPKMEALQGRQPGFVAENVGYGEAPQDLGQEIAKARAQLRKFRAKAAGQPGSAYALSQSFERLRTLQSRQADKMAPRLDAHLPSDAWEHFRGAEELLRG